MRTWEEDVAGAEVSVKLPYFQPGFDGDVKIYETQRIETKEKGPMWIAAVEVVTSNHPAHPVGGKFAWSQKLNLRAAPGAILEFMVAALGGDPRNQSHVDATRPHIANTIRQAQTAPNSNPMIGNTVHLVTVQTRKTDGGAFTRHMWGPATGQAGAPVTTPVMAQPVAVPAAPAPANGGTAWTPPWTAKTA